MEGPRDEGTALHLEEEGVVEREEEDYRKQERERERERERG